MNILLINILAALFCLVVGYIFGSIPTAVWVGKIFFHQDPRDYGSHNAGGSNAGRLWGKKVGFGIILFDMFKTIAPMWICWALLTFVPLYKGTGLCPQISDGIDNFGLNSAFPVAWPVYWLAAVGCLIGHCWPIFAKFKGGKGVSCFMGTIVGASWLLGIIPGLFYFLLLKWKKYVSLASILESVIATVFAWTWSILCMTKVIPHNLYGLPMYGSTLLASWVYASVITVMAAILIVRHLTNIKRLKDGTERKIKWMK